MKKNNTRYVILVVAAILVLLYVLMFNTIWQKLKSEPDEETTVREELNVIHWIDIPSVLLEKFQTENPDVYVNYMQFNRNIYDEALDDKLLQQNGVDVFGIQNDEDCTYAADIYDSDFLQRYRSDTRDKICSMFDGKENAIAFSRSYYGMWYNKYLFERYGLEIPETYSEFVRVCEVLKQNDVVPMVLAGDDNYASEIVFLLRMAEGDGSTKNNSYLKDTEQLVEKGYVHEHSGEVTFLQAVEMFQRGEAAMLPAGNESIRYFKDKSSNSLEVGVFTIPYSDKESLVPAMPADNLTAVNKDSKKYDMAVRFLEFLSRAENAEMLQQANGWTSALDKEINSKMKYYAEWENIGDRPYKDVSYLIGDPNDTAMILTAKKLISDILITAE